EMLSDSVGVGVELDPFLLCEFFPPCHLLPQPFTVLTEGLNLCLDSSSKDLLIRHLDYLLLGRSPPPTSHMSPAEAAAPAMNDQIGLPPPRGPGCRRSRLVRPR